jgi:hypothetical protein
LRARNARNAALCASRASVPFCRPPGIVAHPAKPLLRLSNVGLYSPILQAPPPITNENAAGSRNRVMPGLSPTLPSLGSNCRLAGDSSATRAI